VPARTLRQEEEERRRKGEINETEKKVRKLTAFRSQPVIPRRPLLFK
jgi:hypothetical protein